jgi:hypothetical protein
VIVRDSGGVEAIGPLHGSIAEAADYVRALG